MNFSDLSYLSDSLSSLMGIPVRIYEGKRLEKTFSLFPLIKDPFSLYEEELGKPHDKHVAYFSTSDFFYYALLFHQEHSLVVGPFRYQKADRQTLNDLAFSLGVEKKDYASFASALGSITTMPLEAVLKSLCAFNFVINEERLGLEDLLISEQSQEEFVSSKANAEMDYEAASQARSYTLDIEEKLARFVENGDIEGFRSWAKNAPSLRAGELSTDAIRQQKNIFITSAALLSRAAIKAGLDYNRALDVSDSFVQRCESLNTHADITNLNYAMISHFIEMVRKVKDANSRLAMQVTNYLYENISEKISLDDLSNALSMSKSNLCRRFKEETGLSVSAFLLKKRLEESKRLLTETKKPLTEIAFYLAFSSPAHYSKAFKDEYGITPLSFRRQR